MLNARNLVVHASFCKQKKDILLVVSNPRTTEYENVVIHANIDIRTEADVFLQELNRRVPPAKVQAFTFLANEYEFGSFHAAYHFHQRMHEYCRSNGIWCTFFSSDQYNLHQTLRATKLDVSDGDEVLVICRKHNPRTGCLDEVDGALVVKEPRGFRFKQHANRMPIGFTPEWKKKFLGLSKPARVIIIQYSNDSNHIIGKLKGLFKKEKAQVYSFGDNFGVISKKMNDFVFQKMNNVQSLYDILPMSLNTFMVKYGETTIASVQLDRVLPVEDVVLLDVDPRKSITVSTDQYRNTLIKTFHLDSFKCKKIKVVFKVDVDSFFDLIIDAIEDEADPTSVQNGKDCIIKHRIVFDEQNFTLYEIEEGKQKLVKNLEGNPKTPICIAFPSEFKLLYGDAAMKMLEDNGEFCVYDIIKLCSIDSEDNVDPNWKFQIYKDEAEIIMVQLRTIADGEKHSSVAFLMALILRHAYKIIQKQTQTHERVKVFEVLFDGFDANEFLKKNLIEASKLAKTEIIFH